ncbi:MAG: 6,7-dimethyl-8-ribityllumazine synthase [Alphaproteobacteria bacterium]|nr:6,7-dimethyl-8-ribityllumazine synthase [Alphaproteobacteria bacterium]
MTEPKPHILIAESRYYKEIAEELLAGALAAFDAAGATYERVEVPGAFEIPAAVKMAFEAGKGARRPFDGYIGLGCVIRGETTHYDYVCQESARGLQDLALQHGLAIGYGVLTTENREQAWVRADRKQGDKGGYVANACLSMVALRRQFGLDGQ